MQHLDALSLSRLVTTRRPTAPSGLRRLSSGGARLTTAGDGVDVNNNDGAGGGGGGFGRIRSLTATSPAPDVSCP